MKLYYIKYKGYYKYLFFYAKNDDIAYEKAGDFIKKNDINAYGIYQITGEKIYVIDEINR